MIPPQPDPASGIDSAEPARAKPDRAEDTLNMMRGGPAGTENSTQGRDPGTSLFVKGMKETEWVGKTLGPYQINGFLGSGGMGVVLKAHDPMIDRQVAIKILSRELASHQPTYNRFLAEARAAGKLHHPNITAIYQVGRDGDIAYLALELVDGENLADAIRLRGACSVLEATRIAIDVCKGLTAAHAAQLIHRDIKPANLLRGKDGVVKITDFGLVKSLNAKTQEITQFGAVVGTPYFMSPEQCQSQELDCRSDIYSLGATYYCLLTGRQPFQESDSIVKIMFAHCNGPIPDPRQSDTRIPAACSAIIRKAMAKNPSDRYASAEAMRADLEAVAATLSGELPILLPSQSGSGNPLAPGEKSTVALKSIPPSAGPGAPACIKAIQAKSQRGYWTMGALAFVAILILGLVGWKFLGGSRPEEGIDRNAVGNGGTGEPVSGEPIKVGILHSISGSMGASSTVVVDATVFAIDEINRSGGVLGRKIQPVVVDGKSQDSEFATLARKLITEDKVATVFGCWTSSSRKTVKPIFEELDHLLLYPLQYEGLETSPNIVYFGAAPNQQIIPAVEYAIKTMGKKKFFLIGSDYVFPRTANAIIKDILKRENASVAGEVYIPLAGFEVQKAIEAIVAAQPDMILNTINGAGNTAFFQALRAKGIGPERIPTLSFSLGEQELRQLDLAQFAGDFAAWTYFQSVDSPENRDFVSKFQEKYPQRVVTDPMEAAYTSVKMWAEAVNAAQSTDPKAIKKALLNRRFLAPGGPTRVDADTQHCHKTPRLGKIQADGQFEVIWAAPQPLAPRPYPPSRSAEDWKAFLIDLHSGYGNRWSR